MNNIITDKINKSIIENEEQIVLDTLSHKTNKKEIYSNIEDVFVKGKTIYLIEKSILEISNWKEETKTEILGGFNSLEKAKEYIEKFNSTNEDRTIEYKVKEINLL